MRSISYFLVAFLVIITIFQFGVFIILVFITPNAHVIIHTSTAQSMFLLRSRGEEAIPVYKRLGSFYNPHYLLPKIRIQDFLVRKFMQDDKRATFQ